jgi:hypothetical protein
MTLVLSQGEKDGLKLAQIRGKEKEALKWQERNIMSI